jgi:hypothetical protein
MIKNYVKLFLFLSSYTPLFLILILTKYSLTILIVLGLVSLISNLSLIYIIKLSVKMEGRYIKEIKRVEFNSEKFIEYIVAYIAPFLGFNLGKWQEVLALGILFCLIGFIYIRSEMIYMNPMLNLFGYELYKVETDKKGFMVISRTKKEDKEEIKSKKIYFLLNDVGVNVKND